MKHIKTYLSILLILISLLHAFPVLAQGEGHLENFTLSDAKTFRDVDSSKWYAANVRRISALGLMKGDSNGKFRPEANVTVAEAVTVAARFYAIYYDGTAKTLEKGSSSPWYKRYFDYAYQANLISYSLRSEAENKATRQQVALMLAPILEDKDLTDINLVHSVPDVSSSVSKKLLPLYEAGIITGSDKLGTFSPNSNITRAELAAILSRMATPKLRKKALFVPSGKGNVSNFTNTVTYDGRFSDVKKSHWYYQNVKMCFEKALMNGDSATFFNAAGNITLAEVAAVTARFHCIYLTGSTDMLDAFPKGDTWYARYYSYLSGAKLLPKEFLSSPNAPATREQALQITAKTVYQQLQTINNVSMIPDFYGDNYQPILYLYQVGVLQGSDQYGSFQPDRYIKRSELAAMVSRIVAPELRLSFTLAPSPTAVFSIGKSGAGRDILCYRLGTGKRALVLTFAVHGWEDNFPRDGQMLVDTAHALIKALDEDRSRLNGWSVYIVPVCNPDGLAEGNSHDGPGRRTLYSYDRDGKLIRQGIDLNRSFLHNFTRYTSSRNYNGPYPLASPEAQALNNLLTSLISSHPNSYFVDVHGWYQQINVKKGDQALADAFLTYFPANRKDTLGGSGYISSYAGDLGYHAALFEFPCDVQSKADFVNKGYTQKFISAIYKILEI